MTENQFKEETKLYKAKFKNIETSIILTEADGEVYTAIQGNPLNIIKNLVELAESDSYFKSIFLTIGEFLRTELSSEQVHSLTKLHLKKSLEKNNN
jgi:hypothetical protein